VPGKDSPAGTLAYRRAGAGQQHRAKNVGAIRPFPGMVVSTVTPETSIADGPRRMERLRLNAMLVTERGRVKGIVERERFANALLILLVDQPSS
jgi:hypothetical protein